MSQTSSSSHGATTAAAVELEYFLLGSALASYGAKLMCGSVPGEVKKLGDDQSQLKIAMNDFKSIQKCWTGQSASGETVSPSSSTAEQQLHTHIRENCRCEIIEDWTKPGPERDEKLYQLLKSQVSDPNGSLNGHAPHFVFKVVPHKSTASGSAGSQRIAKEFSTACTAATKDRELRKSGELPNNKCSHRLKSAPSTEMTESEIPVTTYAMHGSKTHNWYSILHAGFRNVCAERVLYGHGIYLSTALGVCQDFAAFEPCPLEVETAQSIAKCVRPFTSTCSNFHTSNSIRCVGVVEVCHDLTNQNTRSGEYSDPEIPETYLVVKNPSLLNLKYLLVWQTGGGSSSGAGGSGAGVAADKKGSSAENASPLLGGTRSSSDAAAAANSRKETPEDEGGDAKAQEKGKVPVSPPAATTAPITVTTDENNNKSRQWVVYIRVAVLVLLIAVAAYYYRDSQNHAAKRRGQIRRNLL